jgi:hypothetical protein
MNHAKLKTPATKPAGSRRGGRAPNAETRAAMAEVDSMLRGRRATHEPKFTRAFGPACFTIPPKQPSLLSRICMS